MPKAFCSRCKSLIASTVANFEEERDNGGPLMPLNAVRERAYKALSISIAAVSRISTDVKKGKELHSPKRKHQREKPVVDIDDFAKCAIRNAVYDMYRNKQHITLKSLGATLRERNIFGGGHTSLWKILRNIGFCYNKDDPKRGLMELPHIVLKRINFLSEYIRYKKSGTYNFVFTDETWIFQNGTVARSWQDDDVRSVRTRKVGGKRLIVLHAGSSNGFIDGAALVFPSGTTTGDYHGEMNKVNYLQWFEYQLLRQLESPSVIVLDNASYHTTILNKPPTASSTKTEIHDWLINQNITYSPDMLKIQLMELVEKNKSEPIYEVDQLAEKYGHKILRLPPYHCIFNPIENIWGIAKSYFIRHVEETGYTIENAKSVWLDALQKITTDIWKKTVEHTEREIQKWWDREVGFDREDSGEFIIHVGAESDTDEYESSD